MRGSPLPLAPVAQLDRASDYESEGCRFDSCRVHKEDPVKPRVLQGYSIFAPYFDQTTFSYHSYRDWEKIAKLHLSFPLDLALCHFYPKNATFISLAIHILTLRRARVPRLSLFCPRHLAFLLPDPLTIAPNLFGVGQKNDDVGIRFCDRSMCLCGKGRRGGGWN